MTIYEVKAGRGEVGGPRCRVVVKVSVLKHQCTHMLRPHPVSIPSLHTPSWRSPCFVTQPHPHTPPSSSSLPHNPDRLQGDYAGRHVVPGRSEAGRLAAGACRVLFHREGKKTVTSLCLSSAPCKSTCILIPRARPLTCPPGRRRLLPPAPLPSPNPCFPHPQPPHPQIRENTVGEELLKKAAEDSESEWEEASGDEDGSDDSDDSEEEREKAKKKSGPSKK